MIVNEDIIIERNERSRVLIRENMHKPQHKFSRISEVDSASDKDSYGLNLRPKKTKKS